ncbi:MAG: PadR family transcriptional regulator [Parachlamydiaceae bacterium]|nr:PadR family transcriptional regulator [Parachlamydiaceae bacterium]
MAKSNKSRYAILGMLSLIPNSSGYDIKKLMESSTQYFWKETFSSIYPVLQELEKDGLILRQENHPSKNDRQRHLYFLSSQGKHVLEEWLAKPAELEQGRNELLLKLFFGDIVPPSISRQHLEEYQSILKEKKTVYLEIQDKLQREHEQETGLPYWLITLDFGIRQIDAAIDWCESTSQKLYKLEKGASYVEKI